MADDIALSLIVIRSADIDAAARIYKLLGLELEPHRHGTGPRHYSAQLGSVVFEIYPRKSLTDSTIGTRLGFRVSSLDKIMGIMLVAGVTIVSPPEQSEWGYRSVIEDHDGHRIELTETSR